MTSLEEFNDLPAGRATELLSACCGSSRWVAAMAEGRPFASRDQLFAAADEIWEGLGPDDWKEAFSHHPRIGETSATAGQQGAEWSAHEQISVTRAAEFIRLAQKDMNAQYERRFGFIYIVCATGKSPNEMFAIARDRLSNDLETELKVAAEEQRKIMRLRLEKLLGPTTNR